MVANYIRLLNKLLESPAEARVIIYMHLLLMPLLIQKIKELRCRGQMASIRDDVRDFLHHPNQRNEDRIREDVRYLEKIQDDL